MSKHRRRAKGVPSGVFITAFNKEKNMVKSIVAGVAICMLSVSAHAQENLVGKWSGAYVWTAMGGGIRVGLDLEITSVEGSRVTGLLKNHSTGNCRGDYEMVGKLEGNALATRAAKPGGLAGDCKFGFRATSDGNKMTGGAATITDLVLTKNSCRVRMPRGRRLRGSFESRQDAFAHRRPFESQRCP
jgi:hypothetical protein